MSDEPDDTFLAVPGCKLISYFGDTEVTCPHLDKPGTVLSFGDDHGIDNSMLVAAHGDRCIAAFLNGYEFS